MAGDKAADIAHHMAVYGRAVISPALFQRGAEGSSDKLGVPAWPAFAWQSLRYAFDRMRQSKARRGIYLKIITLMAA